jgi:hypothetical protein
VNRPNFSAMQIISLSNQPAVQRSSECHGSTSAQSGRCGPDVFHFHKDEFGADERMPISIRFATRVHGTACYQAKDLNECIAYSIAADLLRHQLPAWPNW